MPHRSCNCLMGAFQLVSILTVFFVFVGCSSSRQVSVGNSTSGHKSSQHIHVVVKGDTLYSIAWRYGVDYHTLAIFNGIKPPYTIHLAQKIRLNVGSKTKTSLPNKNKYSSSIKPKGDTTKATSLPPISSGNKKKINLNRSELRSTPSNSANHGPFLPSTLKWQWPTSGKIIALFQGATGFNKGIDIEGKLGESVVAAASGQVVYAGSGFRGYGKLLIIKHDEIFLSAYAHNDRLLVNEGEFVKVGQRIADMGLSGTDRVKLHFEIRSEGKPVDPQKYLPNR